MPQVVFYSGTFYSDSPAYHIIIVIIQRMHTFEAIHTKILLNVWFFFFFSLSAYNGPAHIHITKSHIQTHLKMQARIQRTITFIFIYVYIHSIRIKSTGSLINIHRNNPSRRKWYAVISYTKFIWIWWLLFTSQFVDCMWMASQALNYSHLDDENSIFNTWRPIKCTVLYFWMPSLSRPSPLTGKTMMITIITIWRVLLILYMQPYFIASLYVYCLSSILYIERIVKLEEPIRKINSNSHSHSHSHSYSYISRSLTRRRKG